MKWMLALAGLLIASSSFAIPPVVFSGPTPAIASSYEPTSSSTVVYTITNNVPQVLGLTVGGLSDPVSRTTTTNDCGNYLLKGPSTCNIGITITPTGAQAGSNVSQTLQIGYGGREPLTSAINFSVSAVIPAVIPYVADGNGFIWMCGLNSQGLFPTGSCNKMTPTFSPNTPYLSPTGITIQTVSGTGYAYVADGFGTGNLYQCGLDSTGAFTTCSILLTGGSGAVYFDVEFTTTNSVLYAYVTTDNSTLFQCGVNMDGSFRTCFSLSPTFSMTPGWAGTIGITFFEVNGSNYGYVADTTGTGLVTQCGINLDGSFSTCTQTPSSSPGWDAISVALVQIGSTYYGYVADTNGHVWGCSVNSTSGLFTSCAILSPSGGTWTGPTGVTAETVGGNYYVYVGDGFGTGKVYSCQIDSSDGSFSSCTATPSTSPGWDAWMVGFSD